MKKFIVAILCVCTLLCMVACDMNTKDSADLIKKDLEAFDWGKANQTSSQSKASALLARIGKLPASEQLELKPIKLLLEKLAGNTMGANPSSNPSTNPSTNPSAIPSTMPSTNPSANPSTTPSANA